MDPLSSPAGPLNVKEYIISMESFSACFSEGERIAIVEKRGLCYVNNHILKVDGSVFQEIEKAAFKGRRPGS